ncbi:hypothetical protein OROMI_013386 [Orobanche minor]
MLLAVMADSVQAERSFIARREKELTEKMESSEALRTVVENSRAKIEELENQLGLIVTLYQFNLISGFMPRLASHCFCFSGTKDVKADFQIMGSAISNEMGMMKAQLNCWKETTEESIFSHEKVQSLKSLVDSKTAEEKDLAKKCDQQTQLIRSLKAYIEKKQKVNEELQTYVDMVSDNIYDNRFFGFSASRSQAGSSLIFSVCSFAQFLGWVLTDLLGLLVCSVLRFLRFSASRSQVGDTSIYSHQAKYPLRISFLLGIVLGNIGPDQVLFSIPNESVSVRHLLKSLSLLQKLTISESEKDPDCKERCGWGVVAAESISKRDFVVEYVGEDSFWSTYDVLNLIYVIRFFISVLLTVRGLVSTAETVLPNLSLGNRVHSEELSLELLQATQLAMIVHRVAMLDVS